ncbi:hypothetical protein PGT21_025912 [Puccinia graminis f. sp. tritici]|uniref:Uncharacterized protein n=1 Tax=Puccinia graminis f. sp. tritici TaxID=56615 RepID=A0A5B0RME8_PUCGR|nr:hypothetical protein PGT21_025912 [Puccinia graminis f. sp. tritici]KAA1126482.1 hypothetical protein PGTUg99_019902 [Puccinia graminis f. sp. tritici]
MVGRNLASLLIVSLVHFTQLLLCRMLDYMAPETAWLAVSPRGYPWVMRSFDNPE